MKLFWKIISFVMHSLIQSPKYVSLKPKLFEQTQITFHEKPNQFSSLLSNTTATF